MKTQKGSTLFEFLLAFPAFLAVVAGLLTICYYMAAHHWIRFQLHESMICADRMNRAAECRDLLLANVKDLLPIGEVSASEIQILPRQVVGHIEFQIFDELKIDEIQVAPRPLTLPGATP